MKTMILTKLAAAGFAVAAAVPVQAGPVGDAFDKWTIYSDKTVACVDASSTKLTAGQQAYLHAIVDNKVGNEPAARAAAKLGLDDIIKVHGFLWTAGPACVLKS